MNTRKGTVLLFIDMAREIRGTSGLPQSTRRNIMHKTRAMSQILPERRNKTENSANGVYERIKSRLIRQEFPVGRRIGIEKLADQLFVSATPVREALTRLASESFVQDIPNAGFFAKPLSQSELASLYELQELLLDWSASKAIGYASGLGLLKPPNFLKEYVDAACGRPEAVAGVTDSLFQHLARQSGNEELIRVVVNLNDRTTYARQKTYEIYGDPNEHLRAICEAYVDLNLAVVQIALSEYFTILRERLPGLFRMFARSSVRTVP